MRKKSRAAALTNRATYSIRDLAYIYVNNISTMKHAITKTINIYSMGLLSVIS
jgi:hypothetical protein